MAGIRHVLGWRDARVADVVAESATCRSLVLDVPGWPGQLAGQHVDVRLTAPDGYQASRSYSISSGPDEPPQITVERADDGEVSPHLVDVVEVGDEIEVRGPIGGYFVWRPDGRPVLLVGGGSGIAPLRAMWRAASAEDRISVLYSARTAERVLFGRELVEHPAVTARIHLTRGPAGEGFVAGRIDRDALAAALAVHPDSVVYVCGPTSFVEAVNDGLSELGVDRARVRSERFG